MPSAKSADVSTITWWNDVSTYFHVCLLCVCALWWNARQRLGMTYAIFYWNLARMWSCLVLVVKYPRNRCILLYLSMPILASEWFVVFSSYLTSKTFARLWRLSVCMDAIFKSALCIDRVETRYNMYITMPYLFYRSTSPSTRSVASWTRSGTSATCLWLPT